jgi:hypothetical protein
MLVGCPDKDSADHLGGTIVEVVDGFFLVSLPVQTKGDEPDLPSTGFNATAVITCAIEDEAPEDCDAGVRRKWGEDGTTLVEVTRPDGSRRGIFFRGTEAKQSETDVLVLQSGGRAWAPRSQITVNDELIDKWKVFTSKSSSEHAGQADKNGMRRVLSLSGLLPPGSVVTETYVLLGVYEDESSARNCMSYVTTKFFRFLVATRSSAQDLARSAYAWVPIQDFTQSWSDEALYAKYGLSSEEIDVIESLIRPMDIGDE